MCARSLSNPPSPGEPEGTVDQHTITIFLAVAVGLVVLYFLVMRVFFRDSKALDKKIDYAKMKEWKDED